MDDIIINKPRCRDDMIQTDRGTTIEGKEQINLNEAKMCNTEIRDWNFSLTNNPSRLFQMTITNDDEYLTRT